MLLDLKARALARAQRRLTPVMESGETVLAADICQSATDPVQILSGHGKRVHVVLSYKALYLVQRGGHTDRLPLSEISDVVFRERPDPNDLLASAAYAMDRLSRFVTIRLWNGTTGALLPVGRRAVAMFGPELKSRVPERTVAEHRIDLGNEKGVKVVQRRSRPGSVGYDWHFAPDDGVDVDKEPVRTLFDQRMRQLMREAGDPNEDSPRA
ncbi:hypothetical protein ACFPH6_12040 [Streptomyces xiangluensis]|uniref:Uncharacterized protein n=1 Tax=Streptomyces xiangluensis TaxID=2665720 RepID=A0ABV8YLT0_9ACTN